jgi:hypothetical protein
MRYFILGPIRGLTRRQVAEMLGHAGHSASKSLKRADRIVLANAVAFEWIDEVGEVRPPLKDRRQQVISERMFRRDVGLEVPLFVGGSFAAADVARVSGLRPSFVEALCLADVLAATSGFNFSELAISRKIAVWLKSGFDLPQIIEAFHTTLSGDAALITADLEPLPFGGIGLRKGSTVSRSGQVELILDEPEPNPTALFEAAQSAESEGDLEGAARLYELVLRFDGRDSCSAFNLGNVLEAAGKLAHAKVAYQQALHAEPSMSEAWCNLGFIAERQGDLLEAERSYLRAIEADKDQYTAIWNLARLLCDQERFAEALPLWEKLSTNSGPDRTEALKWSKICRMMRTRPANG